MLSFYYDEEKFILLYKKKKKNVEEKKYWRKKKKSFLHQTIVENLITMDLLMKQCYKKGLHFMCKYG